MILPLEISVENLHQILRNLYDDMMPLCTDMAGVAKGIAGLGALFYVAYRVWQQLSRAEPIDVFPLLRPFAIGFCIMFFPSIVLGTINNVMSPIVKGTNGMLSSQVFDMREYQEKKDKMEYEAKKNNPETAYLVDKEVFDEKLEELGVFDALEICGLYIERGAYIVKKTLQDWLRQLLELLFQAAGLVLDTLRTFFLIVLSILGPIAFAVSVWDGFQATLTQWISRYLTVYLWLPVSDLFSTVLARIQVLMIDHDMERMADSSIGPDGSNTVYIIFMVIGIIGYFTVPTVAKWIVQAGGVGTYARRVQQTAVGTGRAAAGVAGSVVGNTVGRLFR